MPEKKVGFDNKKYLKTQTESILERVSQFKGKLYLEFGGKLCYDYHAARVLPGYDPRVKIEVIRLLKDKISIIFCVSARDVQEGKIRGDFGLTYDNVTLKTIEDLGNIDFPVQSVIINRFRGEKKALVLGDRLEKLGVKVYYQAEIEGYPENIDLIVSDEGYGKNPYIETPAPVVIVTGAGPGSGKMSTCLSQVYLDKKRGLDSGFAKWETFPIWNLPLKHPVNAAYEAATADIGDYNLVDPFHLSAYGVTAINYNRDVENFNIVKSITEKIIDKDNPMSSYKSPTNMGVNMAKEGIVDDEVVQAAAKQEIIRRWFRYNREFIEGKGKKAAVERVEKLMEELEVKVADRKVINPARRAAIEAEKKGKGHKGVYCGAAIELKNGKIIRGNNSLLLHAESAAVINAVKMLARIPRKIDLLPNSIISNIGSLKERVLGENSPSLNLEETLITLAISAAGNPMAEAGIKVFKKLSGCEMHITHLPSPGDEAGLRKLGINYTTDARLTLQDYIG
jgi:uncharacterized protein (UPF0371 family)